MTNRHYLSCTCGEKRLVEPSQAGEQLVCLACGVELEVPTLRRLRDLPVAEQDSLCHSPDTSWTPVRGSLFLVGIMITIISVAAMALLTVTGQKMSAKPPALPNEQLVFEDLADLTPQEAWLEWQALRQLPPRRISMRVRMDFSWEYYRQIAGGFALSGVALAALTWLVRR